MFVSILLEIINPFAGHRYNQSDLHTEHNQFPRCCLSRRFIVCGSPLGKLPPHNPPYSHCIPRYLSLLGTDLRATVSVSRRSDCIRRVYNCIIALKNRLSYGTSLVIDACASSGSSTTTPTIIHHNSLRNTIGATNRQQSSSHLREGDSSTNSPLSSHSLVTQGSLPPAICCVLINSWQGWHPRS